MEFTGGLLGQGMDREVLALEEVFLEEGSEWPLLQLEVLFQVFLFPVFLPEHDTFVM